MDQAQFQALVQGFAQQENDRQEAQEVSRHIRRITTCDGSSPSLVRQWIRAVTLIVEIIGQAHAVQAVTSTISDTLMFEVEDFIANYIAQHHVVRPNVPWQAIKDYVTQQFLSHDEQGTLRDELDTLRQNSLENEQGYTRRFRTLANLAYPAAQRTPDHHRTLVKAYIRGLSCPKTAQYVIQHTDPATIDEAYNEVSTAVSRREKYSRLGRTDSRQEEPMEIGAIKNNPRPSDKLEDTLKSITTTMNSLALALERQNTKIAKLADQQQRRQPSGRQQSGRSGQTRQFSPQATRWDNRPRQHRQYTNTLPHWNDRGQPRCYNCNNYGHFANECRFQHPKN